MEEYKSMIKKLFTDHPASVNESYFEHLCSAMSFTLTMFIATLASLTHAFLPFLCVTTGSRKITELHDRMVSNRIHNLAPKNSA
jgi:hypothetical protein